MKYFFSIILFSFVGLTGCSEKAAHTHHETVSEHDHDHSHEVSVTAEQMKIAGIVIGKVELKNLSSSISVNGTLAVPPQNKAFVSSLSSGMLQSLYVQPGSFVRKGQVIGTIANTEIAGMHQQLSTVNAQIIYAEHEVARQEELVKGNAAPLKNLQKAQAEITGLRAQRGALEQQMKALGVSVATGAAATIDIKAPISGTISEIHARIGSAINANAPIVEIINNSELHLDLYVFEKDLPKVAPNQLIHFTLTNDPGKEYDAKIFSVGTAFVNEAKAVPVHAHVIHDKKGLIEGMSVTARISLGEEIYPAVPEEAVVRHDGHDYIFVLHEHADTAQGKVFHFERLEVFKGTSDVGYTEIRTIETLPADAQVVWKGAFFLMAKMTNDAAGHKH